MFSSAIPKALIVLVVLLTFTSCKALWQEVQGGTPESHSAPKQYKFVNGQWFDGHQFRPDTLYVSGGLLTRQEPSAVDEVVDLAGGFVVPPFGEAHNHNVEGPSTLDAVVEGYLRDGVFYVKNPNSIREFSAQIAHRINRPTSIDVVFANAGLTSSGGHPVALYEDMLRRSRYAAMVGEVPAGWFNNRGYVLIDDEADLQHKWDGIKAGKPDFVKVYLAHSEETPVDPQSAPSHGRKGLHPRLLPTIVERAHRDKLRVTAHVETAGDFRLAVSAGVDEIGHVPGWFVQSDAEAQHLLLTDEDARLAARANVVVVTTTVAMKPRTGGHAHHEPPQLRHELEHGSDGSQAHRFAMEVPLWPQAREIQIRNLSMLHRHGVKLAIGSDHAETSLEEVLHLHELGIFDNLTLLKLWCEQTPQAIFPERRIGRLDEGYEASFLILAGNPIEQFEFVKTITFRVKQGRVLRPVE